MEGSMTTAEPSIFIFHPKATAHYTSTNNTRSFRPGYETISWKTGPVAALMIEANMAWQMT